MDALTIGLISAVLLLALITGIVITICCYKWMYKKQAKTLDNEGYYAIPPPPKANPKPQTQTVKLKGRPEKVVELHGIQPSHYSQGALNDSLGAKVKTRERIRPTTEQDRPTTEQNVGVRKSTLQSLENPMPETPARWPIEGVDQKLGRLEISLSYDAGSENLTLKIIRAVNLPAKDASGTSDPYVKILLLPDKKQKLTTKIKHKKLNPRWNETFLFEGFPFSQLMERTLYLQVLDYDRFSRDDPIGEVYIPLASVNLFQTEGLWLDLQPCRGHKGKLGELLLSLCYEPNAGKLSVMVMKARGLKAKDINGFSDPYVKIWLCKNGKREEKRKTGVMEKNLNPVYNETFLFHVDYAEIRHASLRISVMDYDTVGRNEKIGEVLIGSKSAPNEMKHWNEMFSKPRQFVAQWHMLKVLK